MKTHNIASQRTNISKKSFNNLISSFLIFYFLKQQTQKEGNITMPRRTRKQIQGIGVCVAERPRATIFKSRYDEVTTHKDQAGDEKYSD